MKKIFIYYSFTGNGDVVAKEFKIKGYDTFKIVTKEELPKNFILSMLVGGFKAGIGYRDKIEDIKYDMSSYDEIIIGTPIWNGRISSPINTLLKQIDFTDKKITFVFYSGSGKIDKALKQLDKVCSKYKTINLVEPKKNKDEIKKLNIKEKI